MDKGAPEFRTPPGKNLEGPEVRSDVFIEIGRMFTIAAYSNNKGTIPKRRSGLARQHKIVPRQCAFRNNFFAIGIGQFVSSQKRRLEYTKLYFADRKQLIINSRIFPSLPVEPSIGKISKHRYFKKDGSTK